MRKIEFERIEANPDPCEDMPGWYHHPTIKDLLISRKLSSVMRRSLDGWEEVQPGKSNDYEYISRLAVHLLKLQTFLVRPDVEPGVKLVGNHIDGVKFNNDIDNLEWASYSGNQLHAYNENLRSDNVESTLIDLTNMEKREFKTLQQLARYLGVNAGKLTIYLKERRDYPFLWKYDILVDGKEPNNLDSSHVGKPQTNWPRPFKLKNIETGEEKIYPNYVAAQNELGLKKDYIYRKQKKGLLILDKLEYIPITDPDELINLSKSFVIGDERKDNLLKNISLKRKNPVEVTKDDIVTQYESMQDFADSINVRKNTIQKFLNKNPGKPWNGWTIKYL